MVVAFLPKAIDAIYYILDDRSSGVGVPCIKAPCFSKTWSPRRWRYEDGRRFASYLIQILPCNDWWHHHLILTSTTWWRLSFYSFHGAAIQTIVKLIWCHSITARFGSRGTKPALSCVKPPFSLSTPVTFPFPHYRFTERHRLPFPTCSFSHNQNPHTDIWATMERVPNLRVELHTTWKR